MLSPIRAQFGQPSEPSAFNPLAAGAKVYGAGRPMPTVGAVTDKVGYGKRDAQNAARREALLRRSGKKI